MKVGSLVFATDQGLGILAKSFFDHGVVTDVLVIRHGRRQEHDEWYPGARRIGSVRAGQAELYAFVEQMDVMLFFETPFEWGLIPHCKTMGVKTVVMPMHECMPAEMPALPDLFLCPSELDLEWAEREIIRDNSHRSGIKAVFLPVPVEVPWRLRTKAEVFVHNAGHGGLRGRNGTREFVEALEHVQSPAKFIIRSQVDVPPSTVIELDRLHREKGFKIDLIQGTVPAEELWAEGDVFVFPEKFNGLSLPLQEALASGMFVLATDRFPINTWVPNERSNPPGRLIPPKAFVRSRVSPRCVEFDEAVVDPRDIAAAIDEVYGRDITAYSKVGRDWGLTLSWDMLKPAYLGTLERLCG